VEQEAEEEVGVEEEEEEEEEVGVEEEEAEGVEPTTSLKIEPFFHSPL
jgi:hypothetical protein